MRKLAFLLAFLVVSAPSAFYYDGYLGIGKKQCWDSEKWNTRIEIRTGNMMAREELLTLFYKAHYGEFKNSLARGRLDEAYPIQYKGYLSYLKAKRDVGGVISFFKHFVPREI
jgi:hypothetical protein